MFRRLVPLVFAAAAALALRPVELGKAGSFALKTGAMLHGKALAGTAVTLQKNSVVPARGEDDEAQGDE